MILAIDHALLARVRHSIRALNTAIENGAKAVGLTVQQQAFLLSLAARGGVAVPLAELRADLGMDQATISGMLMRLARQGLVARQKGMIAVPSTSRSLAAAALSFNASVRSIGHELRVAKTRGELNALQRNLRAYLAFYME